MLNRLIIDHINLNTLNNKCEVLKDCIKGNVNILLMSGNMLDNSSCIGQFQTDDFSTP